MEHAPCGFLSFGDDGIITLVNATLLQRLRYTREEVVGNHVEMLLTVGGRVFYQTHLFPLLRLLGTAEEIFLVLRTKSGDDTGVLTNIARRVGPDQSTGRAAVYDAVLLPVTERRKYEDALLRAKRDAEEARAEAEAREQELIKANQLLAIQHEQLETQATELECQAAELETASEELQTTNETLLHSLQALEQEKARADEASHAKSAFLATVSHELRTPLNAIGGYTQLLELGVHGPVSKEQLNVLERIQRSQRHLLALINDVLNLSRIEAGRVEYHVEAVELHDIVHSVLPMIEPQLQAKSLAYDVNVPTGMFVRADRSKLQQILINLLSNAMKFTPKGGRITLDTKSRHAAGGQLFLRIADTGIGIPKDRLDSVFEPFMQVEDAARTQEGTGLGLAISRDLARGMGGDLRVRSSEGRGSVFTITLQSNDSSNTSMAQE